MREVIQDTYFKWSDSGDLMSGIKPADLYEKTIFIDCTFHPNVWEHVIFRYCVFLDCEMPGYTKGNMTYCFIYSDEGRQP
jgi:hypothetical protein